AKIATVSPGTGTTYTDTAATANAQNIYRVTALDATGSESSGVLNQVMVNTAVTVPTMSAATANTTSQITIVWTNAGAGTQVAGYKIYRNGSLVQTIPSAATLTYADSTGLSASTQYCYRVSAIDAAAPAKESAQSSTSLCATTYGPPPSDPGSLTTFVETPTKVVLNWAASVGATHYYIYRNGARIATSAGTTYTDTAATSNAQNIYKVTAIDVAGSESSGLSNQITLNTALTVPNMSSAAANTSSQITIAWTNVGTGTQVAGYKIYRSGGLVQTILSAGTLTYADSTGLSVSTQYCYRVSAIDTLGKESAQSSASLCATTLNPPPPVPAGLSGAAISPSQIDLKWDASIDAASYRIYRDGTALPTVTVPSFSDTGRTAHTWYCYRISALDSEGSESAQSLSECVITPALAAPTNMTASAISSTQINISWAAVAGADHYWISKGTTPIKSVPSTQSTISDTGLSANTQFCYTVEAVDANANYSLKSTTVCATTLSAPPAPPATFTASAVKTTQVNMEWTAATGAASYNIYRDGTLLTNVTTSMATDTALTAGKKYCYALSALDSSGSGSGQTTQVCVTMPAIEAPTNLAAVSASQSQINLTWTAPLGGAAGYNIYKKIGSGGETTPLRSVTTTTTSDTELTENTQYCYIAAAYDGSGRESAMTTQVCATTSLAAAGMPTGLTATPASPTQINLAWTAPAGTPAAVGYKIFKDGVYLRSVTTTSSNDAGLMANTRYCYTVSAYDSGGNDSAQGGSFCTTTYGPPPPDPGNLTTLIESPTKVILNWSASVGASQYYIYRNGAKIATVSPGTGTTYTDTAATANAQNIYRVTAVDATGSESSGVLNQATVNTGLTVPTAPTMSNISSTQMTVSWTNSGGTLVKGYRVYKNGLLLGSVTPETTTSLVDGVLTPSTQYCYNVSAIDISGNESAKTSTVCATTLSTPPAVPAGLMASVTTGPLKVVLSWTASVGATQYTIYRNGVVLAGGVVAAPLTTYTDSTVVANTPYSYTITASNAAGSESVQTSQAVINTGLTVPTAPTMSNISSTQMTVSWTNSGGTLVK
ncbi:MAG: hypothetical protein WCK00_07415, partial [Deltaproteobacteria bacterium]